MRCDIHGCIADGGMLGCDVLGDTQTLDVYRGVCAGGRQLKCRHGEALLQAVRWLGRGARHLCRRWRDRRGCDGGWAVVVRSSVQDGQSIHQVGRCGIACGKATPKDYRIA